jgi:SAM-dependent methyltransferase
MVPVAAVWTSGQAYDAMVGRWSRRVAPRFLAELPPLAGAVWCDAGCGTGALSSAVLSACAPRTVLGVDRSLGFLTAARAAEPRLRAVAADATALPFVTDVADRGVTALMLNFVPDPGAAVAEMARVVRSTGLVAGYVWDYAEGMQLLRAFWDAATAVDPGPAELDEAHRFRLCRPAPLRALFEEAGLESVRTGCIEVTDRYAAFEDVWRPFLGGQGPAGGYLVAQPPDRQAALRERLRELLPEAPGGGVELGARAWTVRGTVPGRPGRR